MSRPSFKKNADVSNAFLRKLRRNEVECSCLARLTCLPYPTIKRRHSHQTCASGFCKRLTHHTYVPSSSICRTHDRIRHSLRHRLCDAPHRALPPVLLPILALGTFASIDALQTQMRLPEHALFMSTGDTVELTGVIRAPLPSAPPARRLTISPDSVPVTLSGVTTSQRTLSDDTVWRAKLTLGEVPAHLAFKADISFPDLHHEASQSWQIEAWPDRTSMQEASPSLLVSKLGIDPLPAAFACLISALLLALLYPALYFIDRRTLARSGCLRVFHARTSGPDTLLYCVQPVRDAPVRGTAYRVLSATGQLLGMAVLADSGRRHCVFRLHAARARAGCIVAVK